jgi:hypothetical protein
MFLQGFDEFLAFFIAPQKFTVRTCCNKKVVSIFKVIEIERSEVVLAEVNNENSNEQTYF